MGIDKDLEEYLRKKGSYDEFVKREAREAREMQALRAFYDHAQAPLVAELGAAGCSVRSVWDLVNSANTYGHVLPILLKHLSRDYPLAISEGIARALAVREAKFAWREIVELYQRAGEKQFKDGLAVAIAAIADKELLDEVIALASDPRHGTGRVLLLSAIQRSRDPNAEATLRKLQHDPDLHLEIARILKRRERSRKKREAQG